VRDELREKSAAEEWTADTSNIVRTKSIRECGNKWLDTEWFCKQRIKVQPKRAMMTRLEPEVATPSGN